MKSWWQRKVVEHLESYMIALVTIALIVLFLVLMAAQKAHAKDDQSGLSCLIIAVPPQAVIGQPDGDTFHLFNFAPGGNVKIRVSNIDTPEKKEPGFQEAKQFTKEWLQRGPFIVDTCGEQSITRIQAVVSRDGEMLADALKRAGLQKKEK